MTRSFTALSFLSASAFTLKLLDAVLVDGLDHVDDLEAGFAKALNKRRVGHLVFGLTCGKVEGRPPGHEEQGAELQLAFH
ncbi:hypothetical protein EYF80_045715 [Liparis tanakae]|uniref:Secreted protein n=1 Tax=Liparis tanakae TaxID=230148 RepID=A0A4Z2FSF3_9TELE|nr:hypothetical protein EYF80_045715 [Liparis tanakae]